MGGLLVPITNSAGQIVSTILSQQNNTASFRISRLVISANYHILRPMQANNELSHHRIVVQRDTNQLVCSRFGSSRPVSYPAVNIVMAAPTLLTYGDEAVPLCAHSS